VLEFLRALRGRDPAGYAKCVARIRRLVELGYELRRPEADALCDGIRELRATRGHVHYRILYFFSGRDVAVLAHALTKEAGVPRADVERAIQRRDAFRTTPEAHTAYREVSDGEE